MSFAGTIAISVGWLLIFTTALRLLEWLRGWRHIRFSLTAWLGLASYVAIHIFLESYRIASGIEAQILVWQISLIATVAMYGVLLTLISGKGLVRNPIFWVALIACIATPMVPHEAVVSQKLGEFVLSLVIFVLCLEAFFALPKNDTMGRVIWQVMLIANAMTAVQILDCQILHNLTASRLEGSSCGQLYGWATSWAPVFITTGGMVFILCGHRNQE